MDETKEMNSSGPVQSISDQAEVVSSFRFPGSYVDDKLKFSQNLGEV